MGNRIDCLHNTYMLLRHGETSLNSQKIWAGRINIPLNQNGRQQARSVVLPIRPDIVISSPMLRARETAEIVSNINGIESKLLLDQRLVEKAGGVADGLPIFEIQKRFADIWNIWYTQLDLNQIMEKSMFPGGESDMDVATRLDALITEMEADVKQTVFLLVTHGGVIRMMRYVMGLAKTDIYADAGIGNCSIEVYKSK